MFRMIRWLMMSSCHFIGHDIVRSHGVDDHSRLIIEGDVRENMRVQLPLGDVFRKQRTNLGNTFLEVSQFVNFDMRVDVLDHGGMCPEFIPIQVTDAAHLRFNEFEENFNVSCCGIVLRDTLPQILL